MYAEFEQQQIAAGRPVKLADGRIGIVDSVQPSPMAGEQGSARAYVVGIAKEFAAWVTREQIVQVYGVVQQSATAATEVTAIA